MSSPQIKSNFRVIFFISVLFATFSISLKLKTVNGECSEPLTIDP